MSTDVASFLVGMCVGYITMDLTSRVGLPAPIGYALGITAWAVLILPLHLTGVLP